MELINLDSCYGINAHSSILNYNILCKFYNLNHIPYIIGIKPKLNVYNYYFNYTMSMPLTNSGLIDYFNVSYIETTSIWTDIKNLFNKMLKRFYETN